MNGWPNPHDDRRNAPSRGDSLGSLGGLGSLGDGGWSDAGLSDAGWSDTAPRRGARLPPFRPSLGLERTRFETRLPDGSTATVDVDHTEGRASLYRDGLRLESGEMPARFTLGSERIEVSASRYGMQRIHLIGADGRELRLDPAPGTPEHWRAQLTREHPRLGRVLAVGAVVVLAINLILLAPQLFDLFTHLPLWADRFPPFDSPVHLPAWANTTLTLAAALAGIERALTFRHHRLLDAEADGLDV